MTQEVPEGIARIIARILLNALNAATVAARGDEGAQAFVTELRDELKPDLDWIMRYGVFFTEDRIDEPENEDPTQDW